MKRFYSVLMAVVMVCTLVLSVLPTSVIAADNVTFTVDDGVGVIGDVMTVDVMVSESSYLVNADFVVHYDSNVLQAVGFIPSALMEDIAEGNTTADGEYCISYASAADTGITEGGVLFTMQFKALRTTASPTVIALSLDSCGSAKDGEGFSPATTVVSGEVTIQAKTAPVYNKVFTDVPPSTVPDREMSGEQITVELTPSQSVARAGDEITFDLNVSANHYMVTCNIVFSYDPAVLELVEVNPADPNCLYVTGVNPKILPSAMCVFKMPTPGKARMVAASMASKGRTDGGVFFPLTFKVLDGWYGQTAIEVTVEEMVSQTASTEEPYNTNIVVKNAFLDGCIEGDVNRDGKVDIADAVMVFRAVNGRITLDQAAELCAKTNDDNIVDIADATALFRFINGRIAEL